MNERNIDRFFERETPEFITIKGGEMRLYREGRRLCVSKPPWKDESGAERMGKTVTINLAANRGNAAMISMLKSCIAILQDQPQR